MVDPRHNLLPEGLDAFWMPFTSNRAFKESPRMLVRARGMYYTDSEGRDILDATAGLWCVNAGHYREQINQAIQAQLEELDFAHSFTAGHPGAFHYANRMVRHFPEPLNHVFFVNSGSEAVDTALKIALAYHRLKGEASRYRLIGRQKAYHGMGFGGISVGGLVNNREQFGLQLPGVDHLRHTLDVKRNAFSRGLPEHGAELADDLLELVQLHGASSIAAVIVEPIAGAGGVILPPRGYLERLRDICTEYGILLIFDEVITGFGRLGAPSAAERFNVIPDMITTAKGITNATIPMGAVLVRDEIYQSFMDQSRPGVELFHGYTYSGHPVACAAAMAALDIYEHEELFERGRLLDDLWLDEAMALRADSRITDIRGMGFIGAIDIAPRDGAPMARGAEISRRCYEKGAWVRNVGDTLVLSPPLIIREEEIRMLFRIIGEAISETA